MLCVSEIAVLLQKQKGHATGAHTAGTRNGEYTPNDSVKNQGGRRAPLIMFLKDESDFTYRYLRTPSIRRLDRWLKRLNPQYIGPS